MASLRCYGARRAESRVGGAGFAGWVPPQPALATPRLLISQSPGLATSIWSVIQSGPWLIEFNVDAFRQFNPTDELFQAGVDLFL